MYDCFIIRYVNTSKGEVVILEFPPDKKPHLGMKLVGKKSGMEWEIIGIGMPALVDMLPEKIDTHYKSRLIWDCLLKPINHPGLLQDENIVIIQDYESL